MSTYGLDIFDLGAVTTNIQGIVTQSPGGQQWDWNSGANPMLSVNRAAVPVHVEVNDTDKSPGTLDDDSTGQLLTAGTKIGGTTYAAGTELQDEYEIGVTDGQGNSYRFVAVSTRVYSDPYTYSDQIIGFTWDGPAPPEGTKLSHVPKSSQDYAAMVLRPRSGRRRGSCRKPAAPASPP
jgi:hypothetical protein